MHGLHGVKLEHTYLGGRLYTKVRWLKDFFAAQNQARTGRRETPSQKLRRAQKFIKKCQDEGIMSKPEHRKDQHGHYRFASPGPQSRP